MAIQIVNRKFVFKTCIPEGMRIGLLENRNAIYGKFHTSRMDRVTNSNSTRLRLVDYP